MYDIPPVDYWCEKNLSDKEYIFMRQIKDSTAPPEKRARNK